MLAQKEFINAIVWQIHNLGKLLIKIEKNPKRILFIILDMQNIYTEYLNQANKANKKRDEIYTYILRLK